MIETIAKFLHVTPWDWIALCFALFSFCVAIWSLAIAKKTLRSQRQTEQNTMPIMTTSIQEFLLCEIIIKVLDGYLRLTALKHVLDEAKYSSYPSEEKLQDLKIASDSIHVDLYYNDVMKYRCLQGLNDMVKAYNTRIDVINNHLKEDKIPVAVLQNGMDRILCRNRRIASIWGMVMSIVYGYDDKKKQAIFDDIVNKSLPELEQQKIEASFYMSDDIYTKFCDTSEKREELLKFMNTLTLSLAEEFRAIMIPK